MFLFLSRSARSLCHWVNRYMFISLLIRQKSTTTTTTTTYFRCSVCVGRVSGASGSNGRSSLTRLYQPLCVRTPMRCYCCCSPHIIIPSFFCVTFVFLFRLRPCAARASSSSSLCDVAICAVVIIANYTMCWMYEADGRLLYVEGLRPRRQCRRCGDTERWEFGREIHCAMEREAVALHRRHTINSQECFENVVNAPSVLPGWTR